MGILEILYAVCVLLLSDYGLNSLVLTWLYLRQDDPCPEPPAPANWPRVTVQLPIYNELHTVERLLTAAARLDYPRDRLELQVLDDSTDETRQAASRMWQGSAWRRRGSRGAGWPRSPGQEQVERNVLRQAD